MRILRLIQEFQQTYPLKNMMVSRSRQKGDFSYSYIIFESFFYSREGLQEATGGSRTRRRGFPLENLQVDAATAGNAHALIYKETLLFFEAPAPGQGDSSSAVDDSMPRKAVFLGGHVKDTDDLAGSSMVSRKSGDLSIGRDFAARDRLDRFLDSGLELQCSRDRFFIFSADLQPTACPSSHTRPAAHRYWPAGSFW